MGDVAPQEARADDMQRAARNYDALIFRDVDVRQIRDECKIVCFDVRTQQQRARIPQAEHELGEMAAAAEEDAMLAEAERFDIAVAVEDGEAFSVFEYSRPVLRRRRSGGYVVLLRGANFVQLRSPSVRAIDSVSRLMMRS